jgi:hypothetical protein
VIPPILFHLWNVTGKHKLWWRVIPPLQQYRKSLASEPFRDPFPHTLPLDTPDECLPITAERVRELIQRELDDRRAHIAHSNGTGLDRKPLPDGGMVSASEPPPLPLRRDQPLRTSNGAGDLRIEALQEDLDYWRKARREGTQERGLCILLMTKIKLRIKGLGGVPESKPRTRSQPVPPLPPNLASSQTQHLGSKRLPAPPTTPPDVHWLDLTVHQRQSTIDRARRMLANFNAQAGSALQRSSGKAKSYVDKVFVREDSPVAELLERPGNPIEGTLERSGGDDHSVSNERFDPDEPCVPDETPVADGGDDEKRKQRSRAGTEHVFMRDEYISGSRPPPPIRPQIVGEQTPRSVGETLCDGVSATDIRDAFRDHEWERATLTQAYRIRRAGSLSRTRSDSEDSGSPVVQAESSRTAAGRSRTGSVSSVWTIFQLGSSDQGENSSSAPGRQRSGSAGSVGTVIHVGSSGQGSAPVENSSGRQRANSHASIRTVVHVGSPDQRSALGEGSRKQRREESDPSDEEQDLE